MKIMLTLIDGILVLINEAIKTVNILPLCNAVGMATNI